MAMKRCIRLAVLATGLLTLTMGISGCGASVSSASAAEATAEVPALQKSNAPAPACEGGFTFDLPADFEGVATPAAALQAWLDGTKPNFTVAPASAPKSGWVAQESSRKDDQRFVAGDWDVRTSQSSNGTWIVISQECKNT